ATVAVAASNQALADYSPQHSRKLQTNLFLFGRREHGDNTIDGFDRVERVQGGENHVAGFGGVQRGADGFNVAHFADQDDVGILTLPSSQQWRTGWCVHVNLALVAD